MSQVNLYDAKTHLSALVDRAAAGEEIVIAKNGRPCAKLVAMPAPAQSGRRQFGQWGRDYGYLAPDVFPETTAEEIALWEDGPVFPPDEPV